MLIASRQRIIYAPEGFIKPTVAKLLKVAKPLNLKTAVAGSQMAHLAKIAAAFEIPVLTLTVPGLRAANFKILCAFNQLHHLGPP